MMRQVFFLLTGLICCTGVFAQAKLEITELKPDMYVYITYGDYKGTPYPANGMYLVTTNGVVLFDTPWDTTQFQPLLDSIEARHHKKVVLCIATHFHEDRTAGLNYYKARGISTWTYQRTYELCKEKGEPQSEYYFTKDTTFRLGNYSFEAIHPGSGHAPDNIVVWFAKGRILYGGCFVKSVESKTLGNLSDANIPGWLESITGLIRRVGRPNFVIPGHLSWTDNSSLEHTRMLLRKEVE